MGKILVGIAALTIIVMFADHGVLGLLWLAGGIAAYIAICFGFEWLVNGGKTDDSQKTKK